MIFYFFLNFFYESLQKLSKCRHFENNQDLKELPRQIYTKLPTIPFMSPNAWKNVRHFYIHLLKDLKDLSPMFLTLHLRC